MEYQEGSPTSGTRLCACGTYAVGICRDCGSPACGVHSGMFDGVRLCGNCWQPRHMASEAALAEESRRRTIVDWDDVPDNALVRAAVVIGWRPFVYGGPSTVEQESRLKVWPSGGWQLGPKPWEGPVPAYPENRVRLEGDVVTDDVLGRLRSASIPPSWIVVSSEAPRWHKSAMRRNLERRLDLQRKFRAWVAAPSGSFKPGNPGVGVSEDGRLIGVWEHDHAQLRAREGDAGNLISVLALLLDHELLEVPTQLLKAAPYDERRRALFFPKMQW